ncbi:uncharacterized protein LOC111893651 isoform X2 [Lactuca sativa]|uniref:uncharacterized protein LOC111893651 isoform X2 n=1 Tax=Lactuca sativa TaxID=4236 RepID=UPI000CD9B854|nr:uncharacterized protein LOC111893651 isoform X2 [Lactuca sativa]
MGTLMASWCLLNHPSKPKTTTRYEKINNGYLQSCIASTNSGNTCSDFESENLKSQNSVDLSWLPNYDNDNSASESHHHNREIDFDYSWLPDHIHSKSSNSRETGNDSWLPSASTLIVNGGDDDDDDDSWLPNYNDVKKNTSTIPSEPNNLCRSRKTSSFSPTHTVTNGNQSKEIINNNNNNNKHKKLKNEDHESVSSREEQIQHAKPLNKKPESSSSQGQVSPSNSNCSVETDSLGGVSTLCRRFQDLAESRNTNRKPKCSSGGNNNSERGAPPRTAAGNKNEFFSPICNAGDHQKVAGENKCFFHITVKPRLIRGRQAFNDFLNRMEQDKQRELECLAQRKPVSQFSYRGRIRALLRFRFIRPGAESKTHKLKLITKDHHKITELTTPVDKPHEIDTSSHSIHTIQLENYHDCVSDYSQSQSDWDDEEEEYDDDGSSWDMDPFDDWISEIARPKSYWECMRRARYHEMRYLYSYKQDLRELLERRCVVGFLSSDHKNKIDELMMSRVHRNEGLELRKEDMEKEEDEGGWSKVERKCWEYNEFIDQTRVQGERSYQSSSSIKMEQLDGVMMEKGKSISSCVDICK